MAGCSDCFTCRDIWAGDPLGSIVYETTLVEGALALRYTEDTWENLLDPDDPGLSGYTIPSYRAYTGADDEDPLLDPFDGTVSTECVCVDFEGVGYTASPVYNPLFTEPVSDDCEALHAIISGHVYDNIDALSEETGFLTPSWNLEATLDMDLTDNLVLGAIAIYYNVIELDTREYVSLYHTISRTGYGIEQLSLGFEGGLTSRDTHYTTVILDELETEGLKEKFGGSDSDIEAALETEIEDLIAQITAGIIEAEYTFKKIKQPTVDVRLFSAFEEGQKEATQTISVETSATITTY
tara:strand:- start:557 stop:1444 length:888 start_codon:yes stop_codon:yes gene_type:complete